MRRFMRDASRLERDAKAEHDFYHSLISQLQTELEDAKHSSELLRAELDRAREGRSRDVASSSATTPSGDATNARETTTVGVERETRGEDEATRDVKAEETERELIALRAKVAALSAQSEKSESDANDDAERARMVEELDEMREHMRTATASAHRANAEVNAVAHQNRTLMEKERRRANAAEARIKELMELMEQQVNGEDAAMRKRAEALEEALTTSTSEVETLRSENEELEVRLRAVIERLDAIESSVDVSESSALAVVVEEKERAMMGRAYADEAATSLRRSALEARAAANAFRARLYPDGDPESDDARMLVIVHAVLEGHPFDDASRDVTNAVRARLRSHGEERLVILVSENLCDLIPDDAVNAPMSLGAKISLRDVENTTNRRPATLRITYAFDVRDSQTGDVVKGDERMITIPVGAAGTPHAFAMQSVWLEAACTGIEDALKASYSRLRDAESTASAAKVRAIALQGEAARMRHHGGSSARAQALERRELEIERREAQLNAEVVEIEGMVARAREEAEAMRREANRIVADASASLRVKDDEIERLRALQSSVTRAQNRSKSWRRETAAARLTAAADDDASNARRLAAAGNHRAAASSLENAERRLARITAACVAKSTSRALAPVDNVNLM